ncbi:MAG: EAL domain-containing protein [Roseobacter sp.]
MDLTSDAVAVGYITPDDETAHIVYINDAFTELLGYTSDEILGEFVDIIHDTETWGSFVASIEPEFQARNKKFSTDARLVRSDGSKFWASVSFLVVEDEVGGGRHICATYRDITERIQAEAAAKQALHKRDRALAMQKRMNEEVQAAQARLFAAVNAYPDPFAIFAADEGLFLWNDAFADSLTDLRSEISPGLTEVELLNIGMQNGRFPEAAGCEQEWTAQQLALTTQPYTDVERAGDVHYRILRSRAQNGDTVVIHQNTTEVVRQRKTADHAHARLVAALNAYPDPIVIYDMDLKLVCWNNAYAHSMTDHPEDLREGVPLRQVLLCAANNGRYPDAVGREVEWVDEIMHGGGLERKSEDVEMEGDIHHRLLRSRSSIGDIVVIRLNSTELVRQRRSAEEAQSRLIAALNAYPSPFAIYDSDDRLVVWNDAYCDSMTDDPEVLQFGMHRTAVARHAIQTGKIAAAIGREKEWMSDEHQQAAVDKPVQDLELPGDVHHRLLRTRVANGDLVLLRIDTTELVRERRAVEQYAEKLEQANQEITYTALHDELTELGNRRYLSLKFEELVRRRDREGGEIAALHIDLDRFKQINDTMGHAAGDKVLTDTSERIRNSMSPGDVVARIGGDEFVILLHVQNSACDRPERLADRLLEDLARPTLFEGKECRFGASIGLARTPLADVDELLTNSDVALYKAKRQGRGQMGVFDRCDLDEVRNNKILADDMLRAIENSEFVPFYQPQIDARTGEIVGMEALARWNHPERGILQPGSFLPVATDLNVAAEIDRMIFEKSIVECQDAFGMLPEPPSLSFNVSANRVSEEEYAAIGQHVRAYSGKVGFELLETIFLEEEDDAFLFELDRLRELGISIEVDDFGSGRASVVALQRIGPDRLKIDRRLVAPITETGSGLHLLRSIVEIGLALEMGVTAEGVETREQAEILARLGCDRLQGYYIARPMPFSDLRAFLDLRTGQKFSA